MSDRLTRLELILFILIVITGGALRLIALDGAPPGLTHDEADHALDAAGVLEGQRPIYFTVGYGREPLYDYTTALVMLAAGKSYFASRLTAALFGIGLMILSYLWVRLSTQNRWLALATMAGLAVGFWSVSTSRQALRSITLPVLYMAAAVAMRRGIRLKEDVEDSFLLNDLRPQAEIERWAWFVLAGILLGLSFYTYLAARVMWAVFPAFFVFLALTQPGSIRRVWPGLLVMLVIAAIVAGPLGYYLVTHPEAEVRIGQLSGPIDALLTGDYQPLLKNARDGLAMLTVSGDDLWLYNIPNRPLLRKSMSLLFYLGISVAIISAISPYRPVRRGQRPSDDAFRISSANAFMLITLAAGLFPALITGAGASNTRAIGMQSALYYFPALGAVALAEWGERHVGKQAVTAIWTAFGLLILVSAGLTVHEYFGVWNNARDVWVAYHTTLVETLDYLDDHPEIGPDVALSTITPGQFHDPAVGEMRLRRSDLNIRWFDGRSSLVFPSAGQTTYFFPEIAQPDPGFDDVIGGCGEVADRIELRPGDFNRTVDVIACLGDPALVFEEMPTAPSFGGVVTLLGYQVDPGQMVQPGEMVTVLTYWMIEQRPDAELVLFTHAVGDSGQVAAQQDLLSVPSWGWYAGDRFIQLHRFTIPDNISPGTLRLAVGVYTRPEILRLQVTEPGGSAPVDHAIIGELEVHTP